MSGTSEADRFADRHIGPRQADVQRMLEQLGYASLDEMSDAVVPADIRFGAELDLPPAHTEHEMLDRIRELADQNEVRRSYIGMGYYDCFTPPVILRNVLENPGWYTAYTPYQAEISQGRMEVLLTFQTMVADLTGLPIANASLLDEATAAAEAMAMVARERPEASVFVVDRGCHPQTIAVVETRAAARGMETRVANVESQTLSGDVAGVLVQYPDTEGAIGDYRDLCARAREAGALVVAATDLLALALLEPPGEWGADVAVGSSQRFGVPMGYGGPHAAFLSTREEFARKIPGRIIGVTRDAQGDPALRMALQTREQHIRKERATSNVCTAQVLLAVVAALYACYHGPEGVRAIADRVHRRTRDLAKSLVEQGHRVVHDTYFDTLTVATESSDAIHEAAAGRGMNLRRMAGGRVGISLDETTTTEDVADLVAVFAAAAPGGARGGDATGGIPEARRRSSPYFAHEVFHRYRSETDMLRYLKRLENRDFSLAHGMIPLGSCTMKLNASAEMMPITWAPFGRIHPFAPREQARGYETLIEELERDLAEITGFAGVSMQPNAGSQGEFAGLLAIRAYHRARGEDGRTTCLIPRSAHGTNPASAVMAGMEVVPIATDERGNIDVDDLRTKAEAHADRLGAIMVTYPSTHGVFEASIREVCDIVHQYGGQVYIDGANLNALVGLSRPGDYGADVAHLNLHKTFCIPHGGGGPGMGPIGVAEHLVPHLPGHPVVPVGGAEASGAVSAAPWGSPSILPISWAYIRMMGADGLKRATQVAILNANYIARSLAGAFDLLYADEGGRVAHECILDTRPFKKTSGVDVEDIAKRLIDYGFHAPTISFPVTGTLMVEPTESEPMEELDRFCAAMLSIREEIDEIAAGRADRQDNLLSNAPHTLAVVTADEWAHPYSRERAAFPSAAARERKVWPSVARVDAAYGDRNLVCSCPPMEAYESAPAT